jgi:hypothetical protein
VHAERRRNLSSPPLRGLRSATPFGGEGREERRRDRCGGARVSPMALARSVAGAKGFFLRVATCK